MVRMLKIKIIFLAKKKQYSPFSIFLICNYFKLTLSSTYLTAFPYLSTSVLLSLRGNRSQTIWTFSVFLYLPTYIQTHAFQVFPFLLKMKEEPLLCSNFSVLCVSFGLLKEFTFSTNHIVSTFSCYWLLPIGIL